jgi:surface protein
VLPANVVALTVITNANVAAAATAWVTDPAAATTTYGPIADWNIAAVTRIASLFYPTVAPSTSGTAQPKFNGDISKWNVASVSNMYEVRLDSVWTARSFSYVSSSQSKLT